MNESRPSQPPATMRPIVEFLSLPTQRGWLGLGRPRFRLPAIPSDAQLILFTRGTSGDNHVQLVSQAIAGSLEVDDSQMQLFCWRKSAVPLALEFAKVAKDARGHAHDLILHVHWEIADIGEFLRAEGTGLVSPHVPFTWAAAKSWAEETLSTLVRDQLRTETARQSLDEIREKDVLPKVWWENQLGRWLQRHHVRASVERVCWESEDADRLRAEQLREQESARRAEQQRREREVELKVLEDERQYEHRRAELQQGLAKTEAQRQHELQLLAIAHEKDRRLREQELEEIRCARERAALAHQLEMAKLQRGDDEAHAAQQLAAERLRRLEEHQLEAAKQHRVLLATIQRLAALPELLGQMAASDGRQRHTAAEHLVHECDIPGALIASLGHQIAPQQFVEFIGQKGRMDGRVVQMQMPELVVRDIVVRNLGVKKIRLLPIGASLQFQFTSPLSGFATLLNIGTSGNAWVHVPNFWVTESRSRVEAGMSYHVPGLPLLPLPPELAYVEDGPAGRENMILIVTQQPLIDGDLAQYASSDHPFARLAPANLEQIGRKLSALDDASWAAGVLSFRVE